MSNSNPVLLLAKYFLVENREMGKEVKDDEFTAPHLDFWSEQPMWEPRGVTLEQGFVSPPTPSTLRMLLL